MARQMTDNILNPLKGWFRPSALDFSAKFKPADVATLAAAGKVPYRGRVVHLDTDGYFVYGVDNYGMSLFLFPQGDDPDVMNDGGSAAGNWVAIAPTGKMMALVATGGYELESTEFVAGSYSINDWLTAAAGTTDATSGKLVVEANKANPICGVVSRGKYTNGHGKEVVGFWPVFLPKRS